MIAGATAGSGAPRKILAVMEDGETQAALVTAAALADRHGAVLQAFACVEAPRDLDVLARLSGRDPKALLSALHDRTRQERQAQIARLMPGRDVTLHLAAGKTFVEVIRHVIATGTDFVVKMAEPLTGVHSFLFTSTDQHLLRKCPCPVWLQTPGAPAVPRHVIAAVDVDTADATEPETMHVLNRHVIDTARRVAAPTGAQVTVLHAWEALGEGLVWAFSSDMDARASADAYVNEVRYARERAMDRLLRDSAVVTSAETPVAPLVPQIVRGAPEEVIEQQSRDLGADLVVMGTVARTGLSGVFIGNTAENIINNLECPVLAVKPEGFVSPLEPA